MSDIHYCAARYPIHSTFGMGYPRCAKPEGHTGTHRLSYGVEFTDDETLENADEATYQRLLADHQARRIEMMNR